MLREDANIIAIVGPTASGKSNLAMELARRFNGEIICADSRTIYRGLDIGTAKPSAADRKEIQHHLLDVVEPGEGYTVAEFKCQAEAAIEEITARGKLALLVGGSGLYINAVLYDYQFPGPADPERREELNAKNSDELVAMLVAMSPQAAAEIDMKNRRRVIRAIETAGMARSKAGELPPRVLMLGTAMNKEIAQNRIKQRAELMLSQGILEEVNRTGEIYDWSTEVLRITGYGAFKKLALGLIETDEAIDEVVVETMKLYKRQITWFKRDPNIRWVEDADEAMREVREFLKANV